MCQTAIPSPCRLPAQESNPAIAGKKSVNLFLHEEAAVKQANTLLSHMITASDVTGADTCPAPAWLQFLIEAGVVQESSLQEDKVFTEDASCRRERFSLVRGVRQAASREQGAESASTTGWTEQVCADEGDKRLDEGENGLRLPCCTCPRQRFWRWHSGLTAQPP